MVTVRSSGHIAVTRGTTKNVKQKMAQTSRGTLQLSLEKSNNLQEGKNREERKKR